MSNLKNMSIFQRIVFLLRLHNIFTIDTEAKVVQWVYDTVRSYNEEIIGLLWFFLGGAGYCILYLTYHEPYVILILVAELTCFALLGSIRVAINVEGAESPLETMEKSTGMRYKVKKMKRIFHLLRLLRRKN